jgi:non-heme chloroperoxidase
MRDDVIEKLFSLFTSPDRAEAIAGDLTEEREHRGWAWFWLHVVGTTLALWRSAATDAPLQVIALTVTGCALMTAPALGGVAAVGLFPQLMGSPVSWLALSFFWWGGALWTGASLVAIAPRRGMAACATLALVTGVLLTALGLTALKGHVWRSEFLLFFTIGLVVAVPLLVGGAAVRLRMVCILCFLLVAAAPASAQQVEWKDPSPHVVTLVAVDNDVQLEVLDWGGSGPALVLLAGLGDTGHVFDDFAPMLTSRYRVVGVTRRAHGRSSAPLTGYGFARLAEDVVRVIDTMRLNRPVVIGHSFAGEELHVLGARYPAKITALVYIDAAFDRGDDSDSAAYDAVARTLPAAPTPGPGDLTSFKALQSFLERTQGFAGPEAFLRARWVANDDGTVARLWAPDPPIRQAISTEMRAAYKTYNPEHVRVPALAIYAVARSAADLMRRWYSADDPSIRERLEQLYPLTRERFAHHAKWFEEFAERGRVAELSGAHHLFISNPRDVLQQLETFMSSLPVAP